MQIRRSPAPLLGVLFASLAFGLAFVAPASAESSGPLFVKIHADWCGTCTRLKPTWTELQSEIDGAEFLVLDVTDKDQLAKSRAEAERRGIVEFFEAYQAKTGTVAILDAESREPLAVFKGELDVEKYRAALPGGDA